MNSKVRIMCQMALLLCMLIILAQIKIDLGYVPITLQTLGIYIIALLAKPKHAFYVSGCYILMGAAGLPVFAGFTGGLGSLLSYNGGYIFAFPIMCFVISWLGYNKSIVNKIIGCVTGTLVCYVIGTAWFMYVMKFDLISSLMMCVVPFLAGDALKIIVSIVLSEKNRLYKQDTL